MNELALVSRSHWSFRFTVMLSLAVTVAVMGLLADSAAVVIGAMLLAPLMVPVLGLAASLAMGMPSKTLQQIVRVSLSTAWCIALAYLLSAIVPTDGSVTSEVLSRTSPDIKDLVVAMAAGLAGAYATVRADTSASLPGVAVAVALVPPLAAVGISLEAGRMEQAQGAFLLYVTNLVAIVLIGIGVFVITGFVPPRRLALTSTRLAVSIVVSVIAFAAIASLLLAATRNASAQARQNQRVNEAIQLWLDKSPELRVTGFDNDPDDNRLSIELSGPARPPDKESLRPLIAPIVGDVLLSVQWVKTEEATTTTTAVATTLAPTEEEQFLATVTPVVEDWLRGEDQGNGYELEGIFLNRTSMRVDVIGAGDPPSVNDLASRLAEVLGELDIELDVTWVRRDVSQPGTTAPNPLEIQRDQMRDAIATFSADNGLVVRTFDYDGVQLTLELSGADEPEVTSLVETLLSIAGDDQLTADVFFTQRVRIETTTTTATTTEP